VPQLGILYLLFLILSGCATYSQGFKEVEVKMRDAKYSEALTLLEKQMDSDRDRVLFLMNRGMIMRMMGDYEASNQSLEEAKKISVQLEAVSVSEQAGALTINDSMRAYVGDSYELMYLHIYKALNYIDLKDFDSARIEMLQLDVRLKELKDEDVNDNAFARYLSGMVYEALDEQDNAMISYRHAYEVYKKKEKYTTTLPVILKRDLLRMSKKLGFNNEYEKYKNEFGDGLANATSSRSKDEGELVVLIHGGMVPVKQEESLNTQSPQGILVRIALPYYNPRLRALNKVKADVDGGSYTGEKITDLQKVAMYTLQKDMGGITARAIARAVIKYNSSKKVGKQNELAGLALNITNFVNERADTRSWSTLPQDIYLMRIPLKEGVYDVDLLINDDRNTKQTLLNTPIERKQLTFKSMHWVGPIELTKPKDKNSRNRNR